MIPKEAFDGELGIANAPEAPASVEQPNMNPIDTTEIHFITFFRDISHDVSVSHLKNFNA